MRIFETRVEMVEELVKENMVICEVGVFKGDFAKKLYLTNPSKLYLVDPWAEGIMCSGNVDGNDIEVYNTSLLYSIVLNTFNSYSNVNICKMYSEAFYPTIPDDSLDVIYIDGDHSYEGVKKDLESCYSKVKSGGFIMGHDYEMNYDKTDNHYDFGVKRAVDEFCLANHLSLYAKAMDGCVSFAIQKS